MRFGLFLGLALSLAACTPREVVDSKVLNVSVELTLTDEGYQPPVFWWDAPIAARLTVSRGDVVVWEVAEGDRAGSGGRARRGPLTPPVAYGASFRENETETTPRTLVPPGPLQPGVFYTVTIVGYDGATGMASFSVQAPFSF